MRALKAATIGLALFTIAFVVVGFLLPSEFRVERQITVNAKPDIVFAHIADLRAWQKWGVWFQRDPNMKVTYSGEAGAVGMKSSWVSAQEGSGEMTVTEIVADQKVVYNLYFPEFDMGSTGELTLYLDGDNTRVVWADYGDVGSNPVHHYFALLMDSMIGPDFETGLQNLKRLVEQGS